METTSAQSASPNYVLSATQVEAVPNPALVVAKPAGMLSITLAPAPVASTPFFENPTAWVPIVTLLGVIITIVAGWKKTKMELAFASKQAAIERDQSREQANLERQHHSEQAHQERITKARREVYLEVIGEMITAQTALSLLPNQDIEKLDVSTSFNGLITAVSKVSILGEMKTVIMSRELLTVIHQLLFRMLALLVPIHEVKLDAEHNEKKTTFQREEIDRLVAEIEAILETSNDGAELKRLQKALQFRKADLDRYGEATLAAKLTLLSRHTAYVEAVLAETLAIRLKVDELVAAIRTELSLTTSLEQLHATSGEMHTAALVATHELKASLRDDRESSA